MKTTKVWLLVLCAVLVFGMLAACSSNSGGGGSASGGGANSGTNSDKGNGGNSGGNATAPEEISGNITVITHRTDIVDSVFKEEYLPRFREKYPNVNVSFESITDYEGQIKIRMNTKDYGDVLNIPNDIVPEDLPSFFEPLGTLEELEEDYQFVHEQQYDGISYGMPTAINASGIVYNKRVFEAAGITELPNTPEKFLEAMHKIKENTDAIPVYTNYAAGWTLGWGDAMVPISGDSDYPNHVLVKDEAPFSPDKPLYVIYKLMYDLAEQGLIEDDPTTTDWEGSKPMIANGQIGAMVLGSWAITQMQDFAENRDDIGFMPFPASVNGQSYSRAGGDYKMAVNVHSENKDAAKAWVFWFANESGFAGSQGGISPLKSAPMPPALQAFEDMGVELLSETPAKPEENGWLTLIDTQSEVGLNQPNFKQRIIEAGIGNRNESIEDIFADLNERWGRAMHEVTGQ